MKYTTLSVSTNPMRRCMACESVFSKRASEARSVHSRARVHFLGRFAAGCDLLVLARLYLALRDLPGAYMLAPPQGAARMHQQHLDLAGSAAVEQQSRTATRHSALPPLGSSVRQLDPSRCVVAGPLPAADVPVDAGSLSRGASAGLSSS